MINITADQLEEMRDKNPNLPLINVLGPDQYEAAHIPGSKNIPVDDPEFVGRVEGAVGDRDREVVVYCANEACDASPRAAQQLEAAGFQYVYDYTGGTDDWSKAGKPLRSSP